MSDLEAGHICFLRKRTHLDNPVDDHGPHALVDGAALQEVLVEHEPLLQLPQVDAQLARVLVQPLLQLVFGHQRSPHGWDERE